MPCIILKEDFLFGDAIKIERKNISQVVNILLLEGHQYDW